MPWCMVPPWDPALPLDYSIAGGPSHSGSFSNGNPAAVVSLLNDRDRLTPYFWTFQGGCICIETTDPVGSPLPTGIKWTQNGATALTPFEEINKEDMPLTPEECAECFERLFGCSFEDVLLTTKIGDYPLEKCTYYRWERTWCYDNTGPLVQPGWFHVNETSGAVISGWIVDGVDVAPSAPMAAPVPANSWDSQFNVWGTAADGIDPNGHTWGMDRTPLTHYRALCTTTFDLTEVYGTMEITSGTGVVHTLMPIEFTELECITSLTTCDENGEEITAYVDQENNPVEEPDETWTKDKIPPQPPAVDVLGPDQDPPLVVSKEDIVAAIAAALGGPGAPEPTTVTGTIIGQVTGNAWTPAQGVPMPALDPPINPSCEADEFGNLVVDLNLPATAEGTASTTYTIVDASAGQGTTFIYDKGTNTVLAQGYPPGAGGQGNSVPVPFDYTLNYTIPPGTDPTDICLIINAFGQAGTWQGSCDEIGPGETIITVTPSPCAAQAACFEEIFGCAFEVMVEEALGAQTETPPTTVTFAKEDEPCAETPPQNGPDIVLPLSWHYQLIWAEEGGQLAAGSNQYSFGNGDIGGYGLTLPFAGEIVGMTLALDAGTATVQTTINGALVGDPVANDCGVVYFADPVAVSPSDKLDFRTIDDVGGVGARATAIYRFCVDPCEIQPGPGEALKGEAAELVQGGTDEEGNAQVITGYQVQDAQIVKQVALKKKVVRGQLEALTVDELIERGRAEGAPVTTRMRKSELIETILGG